MTTERDKAIAEAANEAAAKLCAEYGEITTTEKDSALLAGKVELSNAMSGEPRAAEFLASAIRSLDLGAIIASVPGPWISVKDRLPEAGVGVLVYEPPRSDDWPETVRIFIDHICPDYEDWHDHCESYEHFMAVGGAGAAGPDCVCTGPSADAPYTHWTPLPPQPKESHEQD